MRFAFYVALSTFAIVFQGCSSDPLECTQEGCDSGIHLRYELDLSVEDMTDLDFSVCRNDICESGSPEHERGGACYLTANTYLGFEHSWCFVDVYYDRLQIFVNVGHEDPVASLQDGDTFRVIVVDREAGQTLLDDRGTATYHRSYPNGEACDDELCPIADPINHRGTIEPMPTRSSNAFHNPRQPEPTPRGPASKHSRRNQQGTKFATQD